MSVKRYNSSAGQWEVMSSGNTQVDISSKVNKGEIVINAKDYGVAANGITNDTAALQLALNAAAGKTLLIPAGNYLLNSGVNIPANTTVTAYGAKFIRGSFNSSLVTNYPIGDTTTTLYNGRSNFNIFGLTIDAMGNTASTYANVMTFVHCKDIIIKDVTIQRPRGYHAMEFNAVDGAIIENCRFEGYVVDGAVSDNKEAIQIDCARAGSIGSGAADGTIARNITVKNCYFGPDSNGNPAYLVGIGGHSIIAGKKYENIVVEGCVSEGILKRLVQAYHWKDSVISNCVAVGCLDEGYTLEGCVDTKIIGCQTERAVGVGSQGIILGDGSSGCIVTGCTVKGGSEGIQILGATNSQVSNNITTNTSTFGVIAHSSTDILITGNTIVGAGYTAGASSAIRIADSVALNTRISISNNKVVKHNSGTEVANGVTVAPLNVDIWMFGNDFKGLSAASSGTVDTTSNRI